MSTFDCINSVFIDGAIISMRDIRNSDEKLHFREIDGKTFALDGNDFIGTVRIAHGPEVITESKLVRGGMCFREIIVKTNKKYLKRNEFIQSEKLGREGTSLLLLTEEQKSFTSEDWGKFYDENYDAFVSRFQSVSEIHKVYDALLEKIPVEELRFELQTGSMAIVFKYPMLKMQPQCSKCNQVKPTSLCGRCKSVRYCSPECQKNDWPHHKKTCMR